jgi:hypothetical protein
MSAFPSANATRSGAAPFSEAETVGSAIAIAVAFLACVACSSRVIFRRSKAAAELAAEEAAEEAAEAAREGGQGPRAVPSGGAQEEFRGWGSFFAPNLFKAGKGSFSPVATSAAEADTAGLTVVEAVEAGEAVAGEAEPRRAKPPPREVRAGSKYQD